jgi:hypothetical protein
MRVTRGVVRVVLGLLAATTPVLVIGTPSSAGPPPPDPVPVSLTCADGTYSYVQLLNLLDRKGNIVGTVNLECGTGWDTAYPVPFGYSSNSPVTVSGKVIGYSYLDWTCANTVDLLGASATQPEYTALAKKGPTTRRCPVPTATTGSDVTLTIGG